MTKQREPRAQIAALSDLVAAIDKAEDLSATRRRDIISAARTCARLLNRNLDEVPAVPSELRLALARVHPRQYRISPKRFANIKSDLAAGLKYLRVPERRASSDFDPEWKRLYDLLPAKELKWRLSRLIRYCSGHGIVPEAVDCPSSEFFGQKAA